jgi:hypothetical protein
MFFQRIIINKIKTFFLAISLMVFLCVAYSSQAGVTKEISYQGKLTNASNVAVANGDYAMIIRIYDADSGGNCLWSAQGDCGSPEARNVTVANGIFSIMLGETGDNPITLDFNSAYYLGVKVGTDAEMTPRKKVGAAGYAFNADRLDGLDSATANTVSTIVARDASGNFSAGTITATLTGAASLNVLKSGDTLTGNLDFGANTLTTTNTTVVTNLNADLLDGLHSSAFQTALTNPVTGTGTINYLSKFTGTSAMGDSLIYDDGTNVGIGTTTPGFKVDVNGIINSTGLYVNGSPYIGSQWTTSTTDIYYATGNVSIGTTSPISKLTVLGASTQMSLAYDATNYVNFTVDNASNLTIEPAIASATTSIGFGDETMRIDGNGNLGIGTVNPFSRLTVFGNPNQFSIAYDASKYADFSVSALGNLTIAPNNATALTSIGAGSAVALKVDALGNVGIGTTTPGYKLDVVGDVNITGSYRINGTALGAGVVGTGTANYLPVFVTATTLGNSMLYQSGSNIGIGTVGPTDKLHLYNTANSANNIMLQGTDSSGVNAAEQFIAAGDWGNTYLATHNSGRTATRFGLTLGGYGEVGTDAGNGLIVGTRNASPLIFGTNAIEYMRISTAGNIGIGTTNPGAQLQVTHATLDPTIRINHPTGPNFDIIARGGTDDRLDIHDGTDVRMTLKDGNVGIGTTGPGAKLDVYLSNGASVATEMLRLAAVTGDFQPGVGPYISFRGANAVEHGRIGGFNQTLGVSTEGYLGFYTSQAGSLSERMRMINNGNVGIGTTGPGAKFHTVIGGSAPSIVAANQTVGIFQNSAATGDLARVSITSGATGQSVLQLGDNADDDIGAIIYDQTLDQLVFRTNNASDRLVITNSGNVGIGTTNPGYAFQVNQATAAEPYIQGYFNNTTASSYGGIGVNGVNQSHLRFFINSTVKWQIRAGEGTGTDALSIYSWTKGDDVMYFKNDGNVGIGTTSPGAKLAVSGESRATQFTNAGVLGSNTGNARNHFTQYNAGTAGMTTGWIAATFGDATADRVVIGQADGKAHVAAHNGNLSAWADLTLAYGGGNVGIGINSASYKLMLNGQPAANGYTAWTNYSDQRLKENITAIEGADNIMDKIMRLNPVTFNYNSLTGYDEATRARRISGFIAQQLQAVFPEMVGETIINNKTYLDTNLSDLPLYLIRGIQEQQKQFTSLSSQLSDTNLQLSSLTSQFNLLQDDYLALDVLSVLTTKKTTVLEKNINTLGVGTNFLRDRMEKIATQNFVTADNRVAQVVNFENFSTENQAEISSNLSETKLADQIFAGKYQAVGSYGEIKVDLGEKKDLSASDTGAGYLTFEIYLDNAEGLTDFNTELGNVMDQKELQWNRANHPYFTTGWNAVRLALSEGIKTGEVDWSALNYFRIYFNFGEAKEIRIRNINLELKPKYVPLAQTVDAKDLDLFNNIDQGTALKDIFGTLDSMKTQDLASLQVNTKLTNDLKTMQEQLVLLQEQTKAVIDLSLAMSLDNVLYRDDQGSVLGINVVAAEKVEAKKVEAEDYVVSENADPAKNNVGSVIIRIGQQEVLVANEKVLYNSKIIVTPVGSSPVAWVISEKIDNQGFKIKLDKPAEFDIAFDYWVIGVER